MDRIETVNALPYKDFTGPLRGDGLKLQKCKACSLKVAIIHVGTVRVVLWLLLLLLFSHPIDGLIPQSIKLSPVALGVYGPC